MLFSACLAHLYHAKPAQEVIPYSVCCRACLQEIQPSFIIYLAHAEETMAAVVKGTAQAAMEDEKMEDQQQKPDEAKKARRREQSKLHMQAKRAAQRKEKESVSNEKAKVPKRKSPEEKSGITFFPLPIPSVQMLCLHGRYFVHMFPLYSDHLSP